MENIKIINAKYIFVDFDDTLVIHNHNIHEYTKEKFRKDSICGNDAYPTSVINKPIELLLRTAKKDLINSYVISWVNNSFETKAKKEYCDMHMPGLIKDVIGTSSKEEKIDVLIAFAEAKNVQPNTIIFIDDCISTLGKAKEAGFVVYTPQNIMAIYLNQAKNCKFDNVYH